MTLAPWIAEIVADVPALLVARERDMIAHDVDTFAARHRREIIRAWEATLPTTYRWARLDHPLLASRVKLDSLPSSPPREKRVVFLGPAGAGKTSLAVAMLRARVEAATARQPFGNDDDVGVLVRRFHFSHAHRLGTARLGVHGDPGEVQLAMRAHTLLLDDVGGERPIPSNPIPDIIAERHAEDRVTWITTGLSVKEIVDRYGGGTARRIFEGAHLTRFDFGAGCNRDSVERRA